MAYAGVETTVEQAGGPFMLWIFDRILLARGAPGLMRCVDKDGVTGNQGQLTRQGGIEPASRQEQPRRSGDQYKQSCRGGNFQRRLVDLGEYVEFRIHSKSLYPKILSRRAFEH